MKAKLKNRAHRVLACLGLLPLLLYRDVLNPSGWCLSARLQRSVDAAGNPLPWLTYPAIHFLGKRLGRHHTVLEYGAGNSSLWLASRVGQLLSIEHDATWSEALRQRLPWNASLRHVPLDYDGAYCRAPCDRPGHFDVIIIDGRDRVSCIRQAISLLTPEGVIVLDNSERAEYRDGVNLLYSSGFRALPFWGIAPGLTTESETTIFYRPENTLGI